MGQRVWPWPSQTKRSHSVGVVLSGRIGQSTALLATRVSRSTPRSRQGGKLGGVAQAQITAEQPPWLHTGLETLPPPLITGAALLCVPDRSRHGCEDLHQATTAPGQDDALGTTQQTDFAQHRSERGPIDGQAAGKVGSGPSQRRGQWTGTSQGALRGSGAAPPPRRARTRRPASSANVRRRLAENPTAGSPTRSPPHPRRAPLRSPTPDGAKSG